MLSRAKRCVIIIRYCIRFKWKFQFCVGSTSYGLLSFLARYVCQFVVPSLVRPLRVCVFVCVYVCMCVYANAHTIS